jgi:Flp pilus assembly protein TadD
MTEGYFNRAIADFDQAIRLNPNDSHTYTSMGRAHQLKGDLTAATRSPDSNRHWIKLRGNVRANLSGFHFFGKTEFS